MSRICAGQFHKIVSVWETHWDEDLKTVTPDDMAEATRAAADQYPNKWIISHFIQPHTPYIGETGQNTFSNSTGIALNRMMATGEAEEPEITRKKYPNEWTFLRSGEISPSKLWEAYIENLDLALDAVSSLVADLSGKTIVTSDHGEMFGEYLLPLPKPKYGHASNVHTPLLVKVPWLVIESDTRRLITTESRPETISELDANIEDHLEDLGYIQ